MYSMEKYAKALQAEDYPNAIAIWDYLAPENDAWARDLNADRFNPDLPPIVSSFMPKSGGTFLFNRMINSVGYVEFFWGITRANSFSEVYPTPRAVSAYMGGGYFCHSHAIPSPYFKMVMDGQRTGPFWVHVRHPAEACLAGYFHYRGEGQGEGEARNERVALMQVELAFLRSLRKVDLSSWEAFFVENIWFYSGWLIEWYIFAADNPGRVFFTFFDELNDTESLLTRVLANYGYQPNLSPVVDYLPQDRRRSSGQKDWRNGLGKDTLDNAEPALAVWDELLAFHPSTGIR